MPLITKATPFLCSSPPTKMTLKSSLLGKRYLKYSVSFPIVSYIPNTSIFILIISLATFASFPAWYRLLMFHVNIFQLSLDDRACLPARAQSIHRAGLISQLASPPLLPSSLLFLFNISMISLLPKWLLTSLSTLSFLFSKIPPGTVGNAMPLSKKFLCQEHSTLPCCQ